MAVQRPTDGLPGHLVVFGLRQAVEGGGRGEHAVAGRSGRGEH